MTTATALWLATAPLALLASIACLVLGIVFFDVDAPLLSVWLFCGALVALAYRVYFSTYGARARALSGNVPLFVSNAPWPTTTDTITTEVVRTLKATGKPPQIVGCGWGYFIGRRAAQRPLFTHHLQGRPDAQSRPLFFYCGTTLADVCDVIHAEYGKTFWSTPTHQNISIGSWLARSCHGNSGASGRPSSYAAEWVHAIHMQSVATAQRGVQRCAYNEAKVWFDEAPDDWFIVAIEFDESKLADNGWLQKRLVTVPAQSSGVSQGLQDWLLDAPVLRVLFFGSARSHGLGVTYTPVPGKESAPYRRPCGCLPRVRHVDPHDCSAQCMSLQLDTCSLLVGWYERAKDAYSGVIRLKDANAFSPSNLLDVIPLIPLVVMGTGLLNFEFIFHLRESLFESSAQTVQRLCNVLIELYASRNGIWGRCELRIGSLERGLVFVDTIAREANAARIVNALAWFVRNGLIALHDSKYRSATLSTAIAEAGLQETSPRVVFSENRAELSRV